MKKFWLFILAVVISFLPGLVGMIFSPGGGLSDVWYNMLIKPALTPAGWVFAVVWPVLYLILGIALYLIIVDKTRYKKSVPYSAFATHMFLNALWSYLFFGLNMIGASLVVLIALIGVTIWMMVVFRPISKPAYYMIWPYLLWLLFAMYLNGAILFLN